MKQILFFITLCVIAILAMGTLALPAPGMVLPEVMKPDSLTVDGKRAIVTEGATIYVYSLKDCQLLNKFGKPGEGPKEFKVMSYGATGLFVDSQPDVLLISSVGKLSLFSHEGEFIKELRASHNFFGNRYYALGENYAGLGSANIAGINYMTVNLYDKNLKKGKELCKWRSPYRPGAGTWVFTEPFVFQASGGKIFVTGGTAFTVDVYGAAGKKKYTIQREYRRIPVTGDMKKDIIHYFKTSPNTKDVFQYIQPVVFPEFLPAIRDVIVTGDRIYVLTFKIEKHMTECFVLDLKGNELKRIFLPLKKKTVLLYYPYSINDGKLYQLIEDEENEEWNMAVTEM